MRLSLSGWPDTEMTPLSNPLKGKVCARSPLKPHSAASCPSCLLTLLTTITQRTKFYLHLRHFSTWWHRKREFPFRRGEEKRQRFFFLFGSRNTQQTPCSKLAWSRVLSSRRCWMLWRIWSRKPAGTSARPASLCRAWTRLTSPWSSSPSGMMASTRTAVTETSPWGWTSAGGTNAAHRSYLLILPYYSSAYVDVFCCDVVWVNTGGSAD